jgi:hypothetical protein
MRVGMNADLVKDNMMRLLRNSILGVLALAAIAIVLTPTAVLADKGVPIDGTFAVSYMYPSAEDYCDGKGGNSVEAQGIGRVSRLGPLFLTVKKCLTPPGVGTVGTDAGTFKMTAGNGDTLEGRYAGTHDFSLADANGYGPFQGTLTLTGGTGRFRHTTSGVLSFTAVSRGNSAGLRPGTVSGMAFYLVRRTMLSREKH